MTKFVPSSLCRNANDANQFRAMRADMLRMSIGGWAWATKLTIRSHSKIRAKLRVVRDSESMPYSYTFEDRYSVRLVPIAGAVQRSVRVETADSSFLLTVTTASLSSPTFAIQRSDCTEAVLVNQSLQCAWWQNAFLSSAQGDVQIANGSVYINPDLPEAYGIAILLYCECWW